LKEGFCSKLGEALPTRLTKLFFGGAVGFCAGTITYPSECGVENERPRENKLELLMLPLECEDEVALENIVVLPRGDEWEEL
jgi:hypothetical protein